MRLATAFCCSLLAVRAMLGQAATPDTSRSELIRVFVDCQSMGCDDEFFRTELTWVNFVRDRTVAQVFVLVTAEQTGSNGHHFAVTFDGQGAYAGVRDSVAVDTRQGDTDDEMRRALARSLAFGLLRFARSTSVASRLQVSLRGSTEEPSAASRGAHDKWNLWVYSISANMFANGDENYRSTNMFGELNASRITEQWKVNLSGNVDYSENHYELSDGTLSSYQHSLGTNWLVAKSLGAHTSAGFTGDLRSSKFENIRVAMRAMPGVEFDLFPYRESTRRQLLLRYSAGVRSFSYDSITVYGKQRESRPAHELVVASEARQKWGSLSIGVNGSQYLDDLSKRRLSVAGNVSWRIVRGLEFNVGGFYEVSRDQLNIARGTLNDEDILIRLRQLQSGFNYFTNVGLSYTFGSIFNNVVNPRFGRGGRSFFIRM